jgi:hypothetical protein
MNKRRDTTPYGFKMNRVFRLQSGGAYLARKTGDTNNYYVGKEEVLPEGYDAFASRNIAYRCGIRSGFIAGIKKGMHKGHERMKGVEAAAHAVGYRKGKESVPAPAPEEEPIFHDTVRGTTNDIRKGMLMKLGGISNVRKMSEQETKDELHRRGITGFEVRHRR